MASGGSEHEPGGHPDLPGKIPDKIVVPDDARELDADRYAYLQELRRRAAEQVSSGLARPPLGVPHAGAPLSSDWWRRRLFTRRWERYGLSGPLVALVLLLVALVGSLAVVFTPRASPRTSAAPLASPDARPGAIGGLLPDVRVELFPSGSASARSLRPAVLAVVPVGCDCAAIVDNVVREAEQYRLRVWLVGDASRRAELLALAQRAGNGTAGIVLDDADAGLAATYAPEGLGASALPATPAQPSEEGRVDLVLVHTDGVVRGVLREVGAQARFGSQLLPLLSPGQPG